MNGASKAVTKTGRKKQSVGEFLLFCAPVKLESLWHWIGFSTHQATNIAKAYLNSYPTAAAILIQTLNLSPLILCNALHESVSTCGKYLRNAPYGTCAYVYLKASSIWPANPPYAPARRLMRFQLCLPRRLLQSAKCRENQIGSCAVLETKTLNT